MTWRAGRQYPPVIFAAPVSQPPSVRHSTSSSGPAARWIAPSTPPPPSSDVFAALTMASTLRVVMSATMTSNRAVPIWRAASAAKASDRRVDRDAPVGKQLLQFAGLEHLADDVAAADKLALDIELRNGRPVRVGLDAVAQLGGLQDVQALIADTDVVEDLHHLAGKTALRKLRRALHEQHDVVRLHFVVDKLLDGHIRFLLRRASPLIRHGLARPV